MKSVLYRLYHGDFDLADFYAPKLKEHREFLQRKFSYYKRKEMEFAEIDPRLVEAFHKISDFTSQENNWDTSNAFIQGFSLGLRMMAEAYAVDLSAKEE